MRFDVSSLPTTANIQSASLELSWASNAVDCGPNCGSCASIDAAGNVDVYFLRSDWTESSVNWNTRDGMNQWGNAGATANGTDRSPNTAAIFNHGKGMSSSVPIDANQLAGIKSWRQSNKLSFLVQAESTTIFMIATREGKNLCQATGDGPKLIVKYCQ